MQATGLSQQEQIRAWAEVTIKIWKDKILQLDVFDTGALYESFVKHVVTHSGGDVAKIDFMFNLYGMYVAAGVGKEISRGNTGDLGATPAREAKNWYSPVFYKEVMKLKDFLAWRYGREAVQTITNTLGNLNQETQRKQIVNPKWDQWLKKKVS